jgi:dipeptidyl aminopeptidase/acylaminoacyl peptidase
MNHRSLSLPLLFFISVTVFAQSNGSTPTSKWRVDDIVQSEAAAQFDISPDGRFAVWVKTTADKDKDARVQNLMLSSLAEKREVELTRGTDNNFSPKWSPDGQMIAFISTRAVPKAKGEGGAKPEASGEAAGEDGPKPQLWLFHLFGGEPLNLTGGERGVTGFEWLDNDTIIFTAQEAPTQYERAVKEKKDGSVVVDDEEHAPPVRLFKLSIKAKKVVRLSDNADRIASFAVSRDGGRAFTIHDRSLRFVYDQKVRPAYFVYDLKTGEGRQVFADGKLIVERAEAARDADGFYLVTAYTTHPQYVNASINLAHYFEPATNKLTQIPLEWENGLHGGLEPTSDGFAALLANGARHRLARYTRDGAGWRRGFVEGEHAANVAAFKVGKDGQTLLYQYTTASVPPQWFRSRLDGAKVVDASQLTDINQHFKQRVKAKSEVVRWKGALDEEVEGILFYPHNYEAGKKYPLMLMIHGGPHGADFDEWEESWAYPTNMVCERGAFVLKPNYHGSSNYGLKFGESITGGKYYDLEVPDIEKGVDYLIARGLVDPDKLGTMGWSNGSILSIALTVNSTRYKVCGAGAGDVEWASDWGNAHFGAAFDNHYFGKSPLEDPELYIKKSPFYQMHKVRTPTIIFFGTNDTNVPTQQGWMHYRALQQLGNTDVRFVLFPGEPHSLKKLSHQRRKLEEELAWFDKHLFKTRADGNEAFKKDSPLAMALKLKGLRRDGGRFGVTEKGRLIPETVKHENLKFEIGRFEVTRAQFAAFDPSYKFAPGTENYPANNVTFAQAKAYCEWLSRLTGGTYRLGTAEELEAVYDAAKEGENTLDHWAGYAVNPDDAARLRKEVTKLGGAAPLLKEVGSFKGIGEDEPVFDLGGNVAEWAVTKGGSGVALGGSADEPVDARRAKRIPSAQYVGFRVIKAGAKD